MYPFHNSQTKKVPKRKICIRIEQKSSLVTRNRNKYTHNIHEKSQNRLTFKTLIFPGKLYKAIIFCISYFRLVF